MGLPRKDDWPKDASLPYDSIKLDRPIRPMQFYVPSLTPEGKDLLSVSFVK